MRVWIVVLLLACPVCGQVVVGSKSFTESAILGESLRLLAEEAGQRATLKSFPGSSVAFAALLAGEIDAYPEYTGTLKRELLSELELETDDELRDVLETRGIRMSGSIGFNNTYAIGVTRETAEALGLSRVSDLARHDLRYGFSTEFMNRGDGWPGLRARYGLANTARGIEHSLAYQALATGAIDVMDLYATDAQIAAMDLVVLEDDRDYFPRYDAVVLYRADLQDRAPGVVASMLRLEGAIDAARMRELNELAEIGRDGERVDPKVVAAEAVNELFDLGASATVAPLWRRVLTRTGQHLVLVSVSMSMAIAVGVPLGVMAARWRGLAGPVLGATGVLQTIPSIALLVLLIGPLGIGARTAIVALLLYSLLPIVRNVHAGLTGIPGDLIESAEAIGLSSWERLRRVEFPLALPMVLAGIKTAAVINVGTATLGGFISAGGYGQPIFTGITQNNFDKILEGAVPAAVMAICVHAAFEGVDRLLVAPGLRL